MTGNLILILFVLLYFVLNYYIFFVKKSLYAKYIKKYC